VKQVLVFISSKTGRATAIPPELVSRMQRFAAVTAPAQKKARTKPKH